MKNSLVSLGCAMLLACGLAYSETNKPSDWLTSAESDAKRFELLQKYLRGFDQPMWEVGERFRSIHEALSRKNFTLANYHWEKIRISIQNGYMKRPARRANADAMMLNVVWEEVNQAFATKRSEAAWNGFEKAKAVCMECHIAESVAHMNDQPLFDLTQPNPNLQ